MKSGRRFSVSLCLILLIAFCLTAVFFACEETVSVSLSLSADPTPGAVLEPSLEFSGAERKIKVYSEKDYVLSIVKGETIASVENGKVKIAETAEEGSEFTVRASIESLSTERTFRVAASPIERVDLFLPETATAGEQILLSFSAVCAEGVTVPSARYEVVSGKGTILDNVLTIDPSADYGDEIVVCAITGGVRSAQKTVRVTTVQPETLVISVDGKTCLPGKTLPLSVVVDPENASFPVSVSIVKGADNATYDQARGILSVSENAPMKSEITLRAVCGGVTAEETILVDYPDVTSISAQGGRTGVRPGETRNFSFTVFPADANPESVKISLVQGAESVEWRQGTEFTVYPDAEDGAEIVFYLEAGEDAYSTLTYLVEKSGVDSVSLTFSSDAEFAKSGAVISLSAKVLPASYQGGVSYIVTEGADLVTISGDLATVKDGAGRGTVRIVAEALDGTRSNEISFAVSGRYSRRAYTSWQNVSLATVDENECVWMILPEVKKAGGITVVVPREVKDLVIEGRYQGTADTLYEDVYFYFRNASERTVTLVNFGTKATFGLGGTVLDFGTAGNTEIVLEGMNYVEADSPYYLDNTGAVIDGVWRNGYSYASQIAVKRSGVGGQNGSAGGTAISGFNLTFSGIGTLTAIAGDGTDGLDGGDGADAEFDENDLIYVSGAGGTGGAGGDSGYAIYGYRISFSDCWQNITVTPGNAGAGGKGGKAGSIEALAGKDVTATKGTDGRNGPDGVTRGSIGYYELTGGPGMITHGSVVSRKVKPQESLPDFTDKLSRFYGIGLYYGNALYNPYKNLKTSKRYNMDVQTDTVELMRQTNYLAYTMSQMPKNCWREISFVSGKMVTIYLAKSITSGTGSTILGLTSDANRVWFATFNTEIRGVLYSGYFNIMLHEFTHVFHYNFSASARSAFESELKSYNFGLGYKSSYGSTERVYGVNGDYGAENSCFLSAYSRKTVMEDAAETLSLVLTLTFVPDFLAPSTAIYKKYDCIRRALGNEFETLSASRATNGSTYPYYELRSLQTA